MCETRLSRRLNDVICWWIKIQQTVPTLGNLKKFTNDGTSESVPVFYISLNASRIPAEIKRIPGLSKDVSCNKLYTLYPSVNIIYLHHALCNHFTKKHKNCPAKVATFRWVLLNCGLQTAEPAEPIYFLFCQKSNKINK